MLRGIDFALADTKNVRISLKRGFEIVYIQSKLIKIGQDGENRLIPFTRLAEHAYSVRDNEIQDCGDSCKIFDQNRFVGGRT